MGGKGETPASSPTSSAAAGARAAAASADSDPLPTRGARGGAPSGPPDRLTLALTRRAIPPPGLTGVLGRIVQPGWPFHQAHRFLSPLPAGLGGDLSRRTGAGRRPDFHAARSRNRLDG